MKRIYLIFIMSCLFLSISKAQTLVEQVERAYSALYSASYINKIVLSYAKSLEKNEEETYKLLYSPDSDSMKVAQWFNRADSMYLKYLQKHKILNEPAIRRFENEVKSGIPLYVLNLKLKDKQTLQVDTGRLAFNISTKDVKDVYTYIAMTESIVGMMGVLELFQDVLEGMHQKFLGK